MLLINDPAEEVSIVRPYRIAWIAAVSSLTWAGVCQGHVSAEEAVTDILDEDPFAFDPNESGFIVGVAAGNISYKIDGSLGRWPRTSDESEPSFNFSLLYRANPYLTFGVFQELSGTEEGPGVANTAGDSYRFHTFKSAVGGVTVVGTLFPQYRVRIRGIVNGLWARQSLDASDYTSGERQIEQCSTNPNSDPPNQRECHLVWAGIRQLLDSRKDSQSRFGFGAGVGVEVQWFPHVRATLDVSMRKLDDDYFDGSVHVASTQKIWTLGLQYGPF